MVAELSFFYTALVSASTLVNSKGGVTNQKITEIRGKLNII